jgi:hypothetical protein
MSRDELTEKVQKEYYCGRCGATGLEDFVKYHIAVMHDGHAEIIPAIVIPPYNYDEPVLAERLSIPQEESNRILCIGHKVRYGGQPYVISDIRVWHDLDLELPGEKRFEIRCDLASIITGRTVVVNADFKELKMWKPSSYVGTRPKIEL